MPTALMMLALGFDQAPVLRLSTFADFELAGEHALRCPPFQRRSLVKDAQNHRRLTHPTALVTEAVGSRSPIIPDNLCVVTPMPTPPRLADLLIGQWQQAPRLVGVVDLAANHPGRHDRRQGPHGTDADTLTRRRACGWTIAGGCWALTGPACLTRRLTCVSALMTCWRCRLTQAPLRGAHGE